MTTHLIERRSVKGAALLDVSYFDGLTNADPTPADVLRRLSGRLIIVDIFAVAIDLTRHPRNSSEIVYQLDSSIDDSIEGCVDLMTLTIPTAPVGIR